MMFPDGAMLQFIPQPAVPPVVAPLPPNCRDRAVAFAPPAMFVGASDVAPVPKANGI